MRFPGPRRTVLAATGLMAALALTATACDSGDDRADGGSTASASRGSVSGDDKIEIPDGIKDRLEEHGIDVDKWKDGAWKNWDKDQWLGEAEDFVNPVIAGLWSQDRMKGADQNDMRVPADVPADLGRTDPVPAPVAARPVGTPYHADAPGVGKLFFDGPQGSMVCSATVVEDPAHPGKSNLVWTAGHCVHAGKDGGWYRNVAFVPSYNDDGLGASSLKGARRDQLAPYGVWWADGAATSDEWISTGTEQGGGGSPYDFAVLHVAPEQGAGGRSLQETVGAALPVWFDAPAVTQIGTMGAWGYPAAPPYDGQNMYACLGRPGRLSLDDSAPTEYRIGCTMTGGSSGGGWFARMPDGRTALVSNTSIGPVTNTWLAGPRLGSEAKKVFDQVSSKFS